MTTRKNKHKTNFKKTRKTFTTIAMLSLAFLLCSANSIGLVKASTSTVFEDGFEANNLNVWDQVTTDSDGSVRIVSDETYTGNYAAEFIANEYSRYQEVSITKEINAKSSIYTRAYINVDISGIANSEDKLYFIKLSAGNNNVAFAGWRLSGSSIQWQLLIRDGSGYISDYSASTANTDEWYCIEVFWENDRYDGGATLWINGKEEVSIDNQDTSEYGYVTEVHFGVAEAYRINTSRVYGDNFAISDNYIGEADNDQIQPQPETNDDVPPVNEEPEQSTEVVFADDFESGSYYKWTGTETTSSDTVSISRIDPYEGDYHAEFTTSGSRGTEEANLHITVNEETVSVKGYFKIVEGFPLRSQNDRFYLIALRAEGESIAGLGIREDDNQMKWTAYARDGRSWIFPTYTSNPTITEDRWYEIELCWEKDNQGTVQIYVNGEKIFEINNIDTDNYGNIDQIRMGIIYAYSISDDLEVYGDNFEIKSRTTDDEYTPQPPPEDEPNYNNDNDQPYTPPTQDDDEPNQAPSDPNPTIPTGVFNGLSGYPTSTREIDDIIEVMDENNLNIYRMSANPEWFSSKPHPYRENLAEYFLDNCDYYLIIDRNHIYPPTEEGAREARNNWNTVQNSIFEVLEQWPNNQRVMVELINEYVSSDFYPRMQDLVDEIRDAGYTNPIVVNKWNQPWTVINDPLDNTYQGYHFYFNSWSVSGATQQMQTALSKDIKIINTEVGADYNEYSRFDSSEIQELNYFIQWCTNNILGNTVWMNENLNNWQRYEQLGINFP